MESLIIITMVLGLINLAGIVALVMMSILNGERQKRILTFEDRIASMEKYLEASSFDDGGIDIASFPMNMMGGHTTSFSMDEIVEKMRENGTVDSNTSDEEAMKKFFEDLLSNGGFIQPPDEDEPDEDWKKGKK